MSKIVKFILISILIFLPNCKNNSEKEISVIEEKDLDLQMIESYKEGLKFLDDNSPLLAAKKFNEAELLYPQSKWAPRSSLMSAYSYYYGSYYADSIEELKRFINIYPNHERLSYAYYLIAMSYYERIIDVQRDSRMTLKAKESFETLIKLFPDSDYSREAKLKIELTRSNIAGKQMAIGRFYQSQKQFSAAIRRFKIVIENYETTDQTPEALLRLSECYLALGAKEEAQRSASVLIYNFPNSEWVKKLPDYFNTLIDNPTEEINDSPFFNIFNSLFK